jgi:Protein of unknown function (DUF2950)
MRTNNMALETTEIFIVRLACGFASTVFFLLFLAVVGFAATSFAQESQPRTFLSPGEATDALFQSVQKGDEQALEGILGAGKEVTSSSDEVEDKLEREQFSQKYREMHRLVREPDGGSTVLYIGAENWLFPIPLTSKNGAWYFDSETGTREILFRRIGENEAAAIQVCEEFAIAKKDQGVKPVSYDPITQFAQGIASPDTTNPNSGSSPFHGYYFRLVNGNSAAGATVNVSGHKKALLVAYPAE